MTSRQQHNDLNANTNPRENFKKIFLKKNLKKFREKATQSRPGIAAGTPSNTFYLLNFRAPKNAPSAIFPILYFFMVFFGIPCLLFRICTEIYPF